jgi:hypothetical protein
LGLSVEPIEPTGPVIAAESAICRNNVSLNCLMEDVQAERTVSASDQSPRSDSIVINRQLLNCVPSRAPKKAGLGLIGKLHLWRDNSISPQS